MQVLEPRKLLQEWKQEKGSQEAGLRGAAELPSAGPRALESKSLDFGPRDLKASRAQNRGPRAWGLRVPSVVRRDRSQGLQDQKQPTAKAF